MANPKARRRFGGKLIARCFGPLIGCRRLHRDVEALERVAREVFGEDALRCAK